MEKVKKKLLVKGNIKREFSERAAKIAVEQLGWVEVIELGRPVEIGTKTRPPEIQPPVKLIVPVKEVESIDEIVPVVKKTVKRKPRSK